ncbi:MAG TPA: secretin N-terminal domain-containing protein [Phycisphaerales bacterium]|nr:secretin N-terminal domain-containing protein [Phycisphaerales bacterium]
MRDGSTQTSRSLRFTTSGLQRVVLGLTAAIVVASGAATAVAAPDPPKPKEGGASRSRDPKAEANRRMLEERDKNLRDQAAKQQADAEAKMREMQQGGAAPTTPGGNPLPPTSQAAQATLGAPGEVPQPEEAGGAGLPPVENVNPDQIGALANEQGLIKLNFTEPVNLEEFVNYVAKRLGVNFHIDGDLRTQFVTFKAPIAIPADQLLPLLSRLLEDKNFALVHEPMGWYSIVQPANIPPQPGEDGLPTTKIISTTLIRPSALEPAIKPQLAQSAQATVRMTAIDEIGVLIVTAPSRQLSIVERLVDEITKGLADQKLHRIPLQNVSADYARERVVTLNGRLGTGSGGMPTVSTPGQPPQAAAGGLSGSLTNLDQRLIADQGNALIFRGRDNEAEAVRELIAMVDVPPAALMGRRYTAGSAVTDVAQQGGRMGLGPILSNTTGGGSSSSTFGGITTLQSSRGRSTGAQGQQSDVATSGFMVDEQNGTIIYFGTAEQHAAVERLVQSFNEQALNTRIEIQMYKLKHAKAKSVSDVLNDLVSGRGRTGNSPFLPGGNLRGGRNNRTGPRDPNLGPTPAEAAAQGAAAGAAAAASEGDGVSVTFDEEDVSISTDEDRNQILVKAPARQQREIGKIIERLDQRLPQVYIQAQIVSVTTSDDFTWTVETQINAGDFLIFSAFGLTGAPTGGGATAPRTVPTARRGVTSAVIDEKYTPFVINTLVDKTNGRLVSNPRILVNDNQEASIESTREEPFSSTSQSANTTITGQGGTATAGTVLTVTPQISEGGYLSLEYEIELSSFQGLPRADGLQRPKQQEKYKSTVTVPSDSTIVVGGFTLDQVNETDSHVPFLGDIPVLGWLFKDYSKQNIKTTIFVFITPTIMTDPNFLDLRLTTEGPKREAGITGEVPDLDPVVIPITAREVLRTRQLPRNQAADRTAN